MRPTILSAVAMATCVSAHAQVFGVWVNGEDQGDGRDVYIRSPANNSPVKDLSSPDIACNVNGATAAPEFLAVAAGDDIALEWYHDNRGDDIIDASHQGPVITWIAEYAEGTDGTGAIWSKIDEDGFDGSAWGVGRLIASGGKREVTVPESLAAGKYLIRQEIIAHHESDTAFSANAARGAQFYPSCVQVEVTGSGSAVPDQAFDFNADYSYEDPGIVFNLYDSFSSYEIPGPEVWSAVGGGSPAKPSKTEAATSDAAAPTASSPADDSEDEPSAPAESSPAKSSDAPSGTEAADPVSPVETGSDAAPSSTASASATASPTGVSSATPPATTLTTATKPATTAAEEPATTADEESASPKPTKAPGCKAKRRSMKKRMSSTF
ncbi:glycoside hydrolase family 61 protein [Candidatus Bathyarchaeota archaeon]|nr:glycoside hydrolase family 61 protein [Candidatus Bathyarchaeota archaeon]